MEELLKIKEFYPDSECMIRISTNSDKFGVDPEESKNLLKTANQLNITIKGVSFNF
jgi:diaminopimelate decarboxylase